MYTYVLQHADGYDIRVKCGDLNWADLDSDGVFRIFAPRLSLEPLSNACVYQQPDIYSYYRSDIEVES